jgi:hypothetical protein
MESKGQLAIVQRSEEEMELCATEHGLELHEMGVL